MRLLWNAFSSAIMAAVIVIVIMLVIRGPAFVTIDRILYWAGTAFIITLTISLLSKLRRK